MDKIFEEFIENLVNECLHTAKFAYLPEKERQEFAKKLRDYFYNITINSFIDQISDEQFTQIKDLDFKSKEAQEKMAQISASIPGFAFALEDKLKKEMDIILRDGKIPENGAV